MKCKRKTVRHIWLQELNFSYALKVEPIHMYYLKGTQDHSATPQKITFKSNSGKPRQQMEKVAQGFGR